MVSKEPAVQRHRPIKPQSQLGALRVACLCKTVEAFGEEPVHVAGSVSCTPEQFKSAEPINCFAVTHQSGIERPTGSRPKRIALSGLFQPDRGRAIVERIPHLLPRQRLSAVHPFEDIEPGPLWCLGIKNIQSERGVLNSLL